MLASSVREVLLSLRPILLQHFVCRRVVHAWECLHHERMSLELIQQFGGMVAAVIAARFGAATAL